GSDLGTVLENDIVATQAKFPNRDMCVSFEVVSNARAAADMDKGVNRAVCPDLHVVFDNNVRADGSALPTLRRAGNSCSRVDSACRLRSFIEEFDSAGECQIW